MVRSKIVSVEVVKDKGPFRRALNVFGRTLCYVLKHVFLILLAFFILCLTHGFFLLSPTLTLEQPRAYTGVLKPNNYLLKEKQLFFTDTNSTVLRFDWANDDMIASLSSRKVVRLPSNGEVHTLYDPCADDTEEEAKICGFPLGLRVRDRIVYVVDSYLGLFQINLADDKFEFLSKPQESKFFNDLAVFGNKIYFTSTTSSYHQEQYDHNFLELECTGKLFSYDIEEKTTVEILSDLCSPIGIEVSTDEKCLIIAEFAKAQLTKYNIASGQTRVFISNLPGFPDSVRRAKSRNTGYWVTFPYTRSPGIKNFDILYRFPFIRKLLKWMDDYLISLDEFHQTVGSPYGLVVHITETGLVNTSHHDPSGTISYLSQAAEYNDKLYLGAYSHQHIVVPIPK